MTETAYTAEQRYQFGVQAAQAGDLETAAAEFRGALEIDPHHAEAHYKLGWVLGSLGDLDQALAEFRQTLGIDPEHVEANHNLGALLLQKAQVEATESGELALDLMQEAKAAFKAVLAVEPYDQRAYALLSLIQKAIQRYETTETGSPP